MANVTVTSETYSVTWGTTTYSVSVSSGIAYPATSYINVKTGYGAVGDGVADDTTAIQNAINAALSSAATSGTVYFPGGPFRVTSTLLVEPDDSSRRITLLGDSMKSIISSEVVGAPTISVKDASYFTCQDLEFSGNGLTGASGNGHALYIYDSNPGTGTWYPSFVKVHRCKFEDFKGNDVDEDDAAQLACGIYIGNGLANYVSECHIVDCGIGIMFDETQNSHVIDCTVSTCGRWGIWFEQAYDACSIRNCDIVTCGNPDYSTAYVTAFSGTDVPHAGILLRNTEGHIPISGCKLKGSVSQISVYRCEGVSVEGCTVRPYDTGDNGDSGIWVFETTKMSVRDTNILYVVDSGADYTGIEMDSAGSSTGEYNYTVSGCTFNHASTVTADVKVVGDGSTDETTVNITDNVFGNNGRTNGATVTDCVVISDCLLSGQIAGNTFIAGVDDGDATTITDSIDISGATRSRLLIAGNTDAEYSTGTITNKSSAISSGFLLGKVDMTADDTTPSVANASSLVTVANSGPTAITQLNDAVAGQTVTIIIGSNSNPPSIADSGQFRLNGGAWSGKATNDCITLYTTNGTTWFELSRADNST